MKIIKRFHLALACLALLAFCLPLDAPRAQEKPADADKITGRVHVDQVGYAPGMRKVALVGEAGSFAFEAIEAASGRVVLKGRTVPDAKADRAAGETVSAADFSAVTAPGQYFIRVEGFGRSQTFAVKEKVYADLAAALVKMLYYQRCGIDLEEKYAGPWKREKGHTAKSLLWENQKIEIDAGGGWYDAGDYGRYSVPTAVTIADLFLAYRLSPDMFSDKTGIPESGNGVPDILDEARWGLDWLLKMQDPAAGGVYHKQTTPTFPGWIMPAINGSPVFILPVSPAATADFAAIMAAAAREFKDIDPAFAGRVRTAAGKAWQWLDANPNAQGFRNPPGVVTGEYGDGRSSDERLWAAVELLRLTGGRAYREYIDDTLEVELKRTDFASSFGWQNVSGFALTGYFDHVLSSATPGRPDAKTAQLRSQSLMTSAAKRVEASSGGYGLALDGREYGWGSNKSAADLAKLYWAFKKDIRKTDPPGFPAEIDHASLNLVHYLLGRNPLDRCYVTGFGGKPPLHPHHRPSEADGVAAPVPGMVAGGPDANLEDDAARLLLAGKAPMLCYTDSLESYSTNEVTTYWNSSALFAVVWAEVLTRGK